MSTLLASTPWETCLLEQVKDRSLESWLKKETGVAPEWSRYFLSSPWFARLVVHLDFDERKIKSLDSDLAMRVLLVVSQENSCRYCYAMVRLMLRLYGLDESRMRDLESKLLETRELLPRVDAAIRFARVLNRGNPLDGIAERAALATAGFSDEQVLQLVWLVLCMGVMNRLITSVAPAPQFLEGASSHWLLGLLRPVAGWLMARLPKPRLMETSAAEAVPFLVALPARYGATIITPVLKHALHALWRESALGLREKLLIFATITEGIDCAVCRAEVNRLAMEAGIEPGQLHRLAAHLDAPGLSTRERLMLEFARESLWYEAQRLQRRAQALHAEVGRTAFVEILAVVALTNMFVRMSAVLREAA